MGRHDSNRDNQPDNQPEDTVLIDFKMVAEGIDELREMLRAMVAALIEDGFTDREAHAITARVMGYRDTTDSE